MSASLRHVHILNPHSICCPEHLYEMTVILFNQRKYEQLFVLINKALDVLDTRFLLDTSSLAVMIKRTLAVAINKTAVHSISLSDFSPALSILEIAETLLSSTTSSSECMYHLSTTYSNLSHCYSVLGDHAKAMDYLDKALDISRRSGDTVGCAISRLAKAGLLTAAGSLQDAVSQAKEASKLLDPALDLYLRKEVDTSLSTNKRFLGLLQLQLAAFIREISALEMINTPETDKSAEERQSHAYHFSRRFLPEDNELVVKLKSKEGGKGSVKVRKTLVRPNSAVQSLSDSLNSRAEMEGTLTEVMKGPKPPLRRPTPKRVPHAKESPQTQPVPDSPRVPNLTPPRVIRLPEDPGPRIPFRSRARLHCFRFDLSRDWERIDTSFLLDPKRKYLIMPDGMRISQLLPFNSHLYHITCSVQIKQSSVYLSITGNSDHSESVFITPESLDVKELAGILNLLAVKDVLPCTVHMKFVNSFEKFAQYFLFPFLRVVEGETEESGRKIELWGQANALLQQKRHLFRTLCNIALYPLSLSSLRLILSDAAEEDYKDNCLRIDIDYDAIAADSVLPRSVGVENDPGLLRRHLPSLPAVDSSFLHHLEPIITEIELMGKDLFGPDVHLKHFLSNYALFLLKVTIEGRNLHQTFWTVKEHYKQNHWEIRAKALVSKGDSVRHGEIGRVVTFLELAQLFGVRVDQLELGERKVIARLYLDALKVDVFSERSDPDLQVDLPPPQVETVLSTRSLLTKDSYKVPVTLSLIGLSGRLIGIKATIYNLSISFDYGCFFYIDMQSFSIKRSFTRSISTENLMEVVENETNLRQLLEKNDGWRTILNALQFKPFRNGLRMVITDRTGKTSVVDSLDNVLFRGK